MIGVVVIVVVVFVVVCIYKKILNGIFLPLFFRLSMVSGETLGEVPEYGHFVFFLPTNNPP